ncbi:MAG: DUF4468 domain-containing protein [Bacteroidaceae bacterium]|nr:DUF4468 domain-containing protein [Bacteroidaceae bacterium]
MKKILFCLAMMVATSAAAVDDSKYLAGAVPEKDGIVTFTKSFSVPGKTAQQISETLQTYFNRLVENSITAPGNYARIMGAEQDSIVARACEWMVFKKKPLYLDRTRFRYQIKAVVNGNRVTLSLSNITYYYGEDNEGENGVIFKAEEWISDSEALNKAQTKLYPKSGKFRRKTVDRVDEIFDDAMDAFDVPEAVPAMKIRKAVIED